MLKTTQFHGVHTALITPMSGGHVAFSELEQLIDSQIKAGVQGLVAVGTTGESPTLTHEEHNEVVRTVIQATDQRRPVLAGAGSNSTEEAVALTRGADRSGADGVLHVAPYYNKPSQEGLFRHFSAIANATEKPVLLYSIPSRCGIEISVDTCARLYEKFPHVCGIKEAGGAPEKVARLRTVLGPDYLVLSGDDSMTLPFMSQGARGVISVASNLVPDRLVTMVRLALGNDFAAAAEIDAELNTLFHDLFIEPNPVPVKTAMHLAGILQSPEVRLPLCEMEAGSLDQLKQTLQTLKLTAA